MSVIHGVIFVHHGLTKQLLRLGSILPMLHEVHIGCWTSEFKSGQSDLVNCESK